VAPAATCGIYSSARDAHARGRAGVFGFGAIGRVMCASAVGVTWTNRASSAPWAARQFHTSVVDAAGAIYVIGGTYDRDRTDFNDVWASTDGGARPDSVKVGGGRVVGGC
jgi:hypothetical protein